MVIISYIPPTLTRVKINYIPPNLTDNSSNTTPAPRKALATEATQGDRGRGQTGQPLSLTGQAGEHQEVLDIHRPNQGLQGHLPARDHNSQGLIREPLQQGQGPTAP